MAGNNQGAKWVDLLRALENFAGKTAVALKDLRTSLQASGFDGTVTTVEKEQQYGEIQPPLYPKWVTSCPAGTTPDFVFASEEIYKYLKSKGEATPTSYSYKKVQFQLVGYTDPDKLSEVPLVNESAGAKDFPFSNCLALLCHFLQVDALAPSGCILTKPFRNLVNEFLDSFPVQTTRAQFGNYLDTEKPFSSPVGLPEGDATTSPRLGLRLAPSVSRPTWDKSGPEGKKLSIPFYLILEVGMETDEVPDVMTWGAETTAEIDIDLLEIQDEKDDLKTLCDLYVTNHFSAIADNPLKSGPFLECKSVDEWIMAYSAYVTKWVPEAPGPDIYFPFTFLQSSFADGAYELPAKGMGYPGFRPTSFKPVKYMKHKGQAARAAREVLRYLLRQYGTNMADVFDENNNLTEVVNNESVWLKFRTIAPNVYLPEPNNEQTLSAWLGTLPDEGVDADCGLQVVWPIAWDNPAGPNTKKTKYMPLEVLVEKGWPGPEGFLGAPQPLHDPPDFLGVSPSMWSFYREKQGYALARGKALVALYKLYVEYWLNDSSWAWEDMEMPPITNPWARLNNIPYPGWPAEYSTGPHLRLMLTLSGHGYKKTNNKWPAVSVYPNDGSACAYIATSCLLGVEGSCSPEDYVHDASLSYPPVNSETLLRVDGQERSLYAFAWPWTNDKPTCRLVKEEQNPPQAICGFVSSVKGFYGVPSLPATDAEPSLGDW